MISYHSCHYFSWAYFHWVQYIDRGFKHSGPRLSPFLSLRVTSLQYDQLKPSGSHSAFFPASWKFWGCGSPLIPKKPHYKECICDGIRWLSCLVILAIYYWGRLCQLQQAIMRPSFMRVWWQWRATKRTSVDEFAAGVLVVVDSSLRRRSHLIRLPSCSVPFARC